MAKNMEEIEALRARVFACEASMWLHEMDAWLGLPEGAHAAWRSRFARALWKKEDLLHALRGEGQSIEWARETSRADAANYDAVLAEDARREEIDRKKRSDDEREAA